MHISISVFLQPKYYYFLFQDQGPVGGSGEALHALHWPHDPRGPRGQERWDAWHVTRDNIVTRGVQVSGSASGSSATTGGTAPPWRTPPSSAPSSPSVSSPSSSSSYSVWFWLLVSAVSADKKCKINLKLVNKMQQWQKAVFYAKYDGPSCS